MPRSPRKPCSHPMCPKLTYGKYCDEHQELHRSDRENAARRGYDHRWQKARARYLRSYPLCMKCQEAGRLVKATVVDHIVPHRGDMRLFWDESNWQPLCKHCHDQKTMTDDRYQEYKY